MSGGIKMDGTSDHIISSIPYSLIKRVIEFNQQKFIKSEHRINLYKSKISTISNQFELKNVLDISFRSFSGETGLLYLHTNQGVFAFEVNADPTYFINEYKKLKF